MTAIRNDDLTKITAKRINEALSDNGMKAQDLANASGISKSSISQYVNGTHAPSNIAAYKLGKVLNVRPEWLMGLDDHKTDVPTVAPGVGELLDLYSRATPDQRKAVINLLRSFVSQ